MARTSNKDNHQDQDQDRRRYAYGRIIADCVDCGEETWWLRGRGTDGGNSVSLTVATGRSYRVGYLLSNDPDLPIPDEPRCYDCTDKYDPADASEYVEWLTRSRQHMRDCVTHGVIGIEGLRALLEVGTISYRQFKELETLTTIERN